MTIVRIPPALLEQAKSAAVERGMSLNDLVVRSLEHELEVSGEPSGPFLDSLRAWLRSEFDGGFPQDVTLRVFRHIRQTPALFNAYTACVADKHGSVDAKRRDSLHRRIGLLVKRTLKATAHGGSLPLKPGVDLITSYRLLHANNSPAYWNGLPFPPEAQRLALPDGRTLDDAVVWPGFCQRELGIDPEELWRELTELPMWPSESPLLFRERGDDPRWVTGKNDALRYRGHELKRAKIWFQSDYPLGLRRYRYTGWRSAPATTPCNASWNPVPSSSPTPSG